MRQRERFERIDVPRETPYRNVIGGVVCAVVLVVAAIVVATVWNRVQLESRLGDTGLTDALEDQGTTGVAEGGGYVASADEHTVVLFLTAQSLDAGAALDEVRVLSLNTTQGTAALASVSPSVKLTVDDAPTTLADLYASQGSAACVAPLAAAAGVPFDHVVVATGDVIEEAASLSGSDASTLVASASSLLSKIRTDMDPQELLSLAETLSSAGLASLAVSEAPTYAETVADESGAVSETGYTLVDAVQLNVLLGLLVPAA